LTSSLLFAQDGPAKNLNRAGALLPLAFCPRTQALIRYEAVNAMLLNEFLKEHRMVQELKSIVAKQEATAVQQ